jgi:hypothetical protein
MTEWKEIVNQNGELILIKGKPPEWRSCWIGAPEVFALDQVCSLISQAFDETCYLVGSATEKREFRDVDVRMIMGDDKWTQLFGSQDHGQHIAFWSLLCTSISEYMQKRTGLKVDFQIQKRKAVTAADWEKIRSPLGLFYSNVGPEWRDGAPQK